MEKEIEITIVFRVSGLGTPAVLFSPFHVGVSLSKLNIKKKGTLVIKGSSEP